MIKWKTLLKSLEDSGLKQFKMILKNKKEIS